MTHRYRRYADRVGIRSSLKELRHYSATQLLHAGVDLNTVAARLGHAEGSTTLKFYAQFVRLSDQHAATVIPSQLDTLRRKQRLTELLGGREVPVSPESLKELAAVLAPQPGLTRKRHRPGWPSLRSRPDPAGGVTDRYHMRTSAVGRP